MNTTRLVGETLEEKDSLADGMAPSCVIKYAYESKSPEQVNFSKPSSITTSGDDVSVRVGAAISIKLKCAPPSMYLIFLWYSAIAIALSGANSVSPSSLP